MNYDELVLLERMGVFRYSTITEQLTVFSSLIWERSVPLPEKIDSPRLQLSFCHIVKGTTLFLLAQQTGHFAIICHKMPCFFKLDILKSFTFTQ